MSQDWARIANTTIQKHFRGEEVNVLRNRKLTALIEKEGRITFNHSGDGMTWRLRYKRSPMTGYSDGDVLNFPRRNRHVTAELPWRGYWAGESMSKVERLKNRGKEAIVDIWANLADWQLEDITENFADEWYKDGNLAANIKGIHGIESFMGQSGTSSFIGTSSDTFAGLSTVLGAKGGSWTGTWPTGTGSPEYDYFTPLLVDTTNASWTAATKTWPFTCIEALRFAIIKSAKNKSKKGMLDLILLNDEMYRQFLDALDDKERIQVTNATKDSKLIKLGFGQVQNFDGVDVTFEYGVASDTGYGFNISQMELRSMQDVLFKPEGPTYNEADSSWRLKTDFLGNATWNPRYFVKFKNYS